MSISTLVLVPKNKLSQTSEPFQLFVTEWFKEVTIEGIEFYTAKDDFSYRPDRDFVMKKENGRRIPRSERFKGVFKSSCWMTSQYAEVSIDELLCLLQAGGIVYKFHCGDTGMSDGFDDD